MTKITLKKATVENVDDIIRIEKSVDGTKIYSALTDRQEIVQDIQNNFLFLIELDGQITGDISYELKNDDEAYFSGLAIMPQFQGQGVAKQAVKMILDELKEMKLVYLLTHPENGRAIKLYESLGFEKTGERYENHFGDGEPRIRMVLKK